MANPKDSKPIVIKENTMESLLRRKKTPKDSYDDVIQTLLSKHPGGSEDDKQ